MDNGGTVACVVLLIIILFVCAGNSYVNYKTYKQQRPYRQDIKCEQCVNRKSIELNQTSKYSGSSDGVPARIVYNACRCIDQCKGPCLMQNKKGTWVPASQKALTSQLDQFSQPDT